MKRFISVITVFVLLFSSVPTVLKGEAKAFYYEEMADMLNAMDILHGDGTGYNFNGMLTRAQFTKLAIAASSYKNSVPSATNTSPFSDVKYTHWAAGYIKVAITNSIVSGYPDSTFKPESYVKTEEAVTVLLKMLGYTNQDFGAEWPHGQMGIAKNIGLLDDVYTPTGANLIRRDAIAMIYNMMGLNAKDGGLYISKLGYARTDDVIIIASSKEDTTIDPDKVYTSSGYFKINSSFTPAFVGRTGDMIVKQANNEIIGFYPLEQGISEYTVSSVTGDDIWLTKDGAARLLSIQNNTVVYDKTTKTTFSQISANIDEGDKITIVTNKDGFVSYLLYSGQENSAFENTDLKSYVVSATLGTNIIVSENGVNKTLVIPTDTTAYYDSAKTSYTSLVSQLTPGDIINVITDISGKIRYVSVDTNQLMGPYTYIQGITSESLGIPANAKFQKNGKAIAFNTLKTNDILYYSKTLNTVWVYSESKTGVIENLTPNEDYPTSVTLSGTNYNIESAAALSELSAARKYKVGDIVTILLGRNGGIADVISPDFSETYTVGAILGSNIVVNDKGTNKNLSAPSNTVAYYNSSKTTFSNLTAMVKSGDIISVIRDSEGNIDFISVDTGLLDGPYTAGTSSIFTVYNIPSDATILKSGSKISASDIKPNDIVYYSSTLNTVLVYSDKKTGVYQSASPNNDLPTSIILAGESYNIESAAALSKLSAGGKYKSGDTITILLGRNSGIADVISPDFSEIYTVTAILGSNIVVNDKGTNKNLTAPANTVAYYDSSKTTFSSLLTMIKSGDIISVIRDSKGNIDFVSVDTGLLDGPYTAGTSSIFTAYNIPSDATVLKGGSKVSSSDIKPNDIVYYSSTLNTVWVYSDKKTGVYQSASPNNDLPTSITLSGQSYNIESAAAFTKLSSGGIFPYGSTVTLLLGRNGEIADVISPATADTIYAYVISTGKAVYKNNAGSDYTSYNVTVATPDGHTYEYMTSRDYSTYVSNVVKVTFDDSSAVLSLYTNDDNISGVIDARDLKIGKTRVSKNVNIIDVKKKIVNRDGGFLRTYLSRLDGINIYSSQILYAGKNAGGEIDELIIENVTGDVYDYGIITSNTLTGSNMSTSGIGEVMLYGKEYSFYDGFTVKAGTPVKLDSSYANMPPFNVYSIEELNAVDGKIVSMKEATITNDSKETYYLSDTVSIYTHTNSLGYMLITMEEFKENFDDYSSIRAYYDKSMSTGGRVRIIVAK